jgi:hypothetical protein
MVALSTMLEEVGRKTGSLMMVESSGSKNSKGASSVRSSIFFIESGVAERRGDLVGHSSGHSVLQ